MKSLCLKAAAKINWRLAVTGRREDGYHSLYGLMQSISLCDDIRLSVEKDRDICLCTPALPGLAMENNLALRAWHVLKKQLHLRDTFLRIEIDKRIPAGSGLGGGSADAAAVIKGANALLSLGLSLADMQALALPLGADIPFCLLGGLALAAGVGEELQPLPAAPVRHLVLANAGFPVATAQVFAAFRQGGYAYADPVQEAEQTACLAEALQAGSSDKIIPLLKNDLEAPAVTLYPEIAVVKARLQAAGCSPVMSGSGGTVFALAPSASAAVALAARLKSSLAWVCAAHTI